MAADQHLILRDKCIPDSMAVKIVKPMSLEQGRLVKRIRTGTANPSQCEGTEEPEGMADAPVENVLKKIIKGVNTPQVIEVDAEAGPIKREHKTPKPPILPKPSLKKEKSTPLTSKTSPKPSTSGLRMPTGLSAKAKSVLKNLGFEEGGYSPKLASKSYKRVKMIAAEKLSQGWEAWDYPVRKSLGFDVDKGDTDSDND